MIAMILFQNMSGNRFLWLGGTTVSTPFLYKEMMVICLKCKEIRHFSVKNFYTFENCHILLMYAFYIKFNFESNCY